MPEKGIQDEGRDEEIDIAKATEVAREYLKDNIGNLNLHQFRIESVRKNGDNTRYIVICSIVPDVGEDRAYYLIKVDVKNGKIVPPLGRGKKIDDKLSLEVIKIDPKWTE